MAPQFVKPYVKTNKHDMQGEFVPLKMLFKINSHPLAAGHPPPNLI
jgi:hypothetical protein